LFLVHRFLSPWWRRRQVPPKRRFLQEPHGVTTQKTPFFTEGMIKLTVIIIVEYHWYQLHTTFCRTFFPDVKVHIYAKFWAIIDVGFDVTDQLLIRSSDCFNWFRKILNWLSLWSSALLERPPVVYPTFYGTWRLITAFRGAVSLCLFLARSI
jgi:hypothetical protein